MDARSAVILTAGWDAYSIDMVELVPRPFSNDTTGKDVSESIRIVDSITSASSWVLHAGSRLRHYLGILTKLSSQTAQPLSQRSWQLSCRL